MVEERYTGNEDADKKVKNTAKLRRQQELNDVRHVVGSAAGRRFMRRIIEGAGYFDDPHVPGSFDLTGRKCGMRFLAQFILNEAMDASPDAYLAILVDTDSKG